jgi:signal transduction histidine kinase
MLAYSKSPSLLLAKRQTFDFNSLLHKLIALLTVPENMCINLPDERHELNMSVIAFEQIMLNLISNAIRYNDKEIGVLTISFIPDPDFYKFEVADNGIGIAEQYHEKIFGNHFTLKITDRYNRQGSGIGLSTVKDLIVALGGSIAVRSTPGIGTTFLIAIKK